MRLPLLILPFLLLAPGVEAQRGGPHDGFYEGTRFQECGRAGGRVWQARVVGEVRFGRITIPGLPGDPPLEGEIGPDGKVALPGFGLFRAGEGQILEGANNARRFVSRHSGRGQCRIVHEMLRQPSGR
ncbi:hypothetical protein [Sabulicella glaciei]|nr:hypothetical protein [Roseococcus sp. MDT2-1-1]